MERTLEVTYQVIFETQPDGSSKPKIIIQYENLPENLEHDRKHRELVQKLMKELGIPDVEVYPVQPPPMPNLEPYKDTNKVQDQEQSQQSTRITNANAN